VGLASLAYSTTPIQAAILSPLLGVADRFTVRRLVALVLGPLGVAVAFGGLRAHGNLPVLATGSVLLAATTSAAGTVMVRRWSNIHPLWMNAYANLSASFVLWLLYLLRPTGPAVPQTPSGWVGFLYMLLGGSVLAFAMYFLLVRSWDAARASFTTLTTPFVALLFGYLVANETVHASELLGALTLLAAGAFLLPVPSPAVATRATKPLSSIPDGARPPSPPAALAPDPAERA
jgi:drug/metabolite transporter (DMT)-like permease